MDPFRIFSGIRVSMYKYQPDVIKVKWNHFGQKHRFRVECHKDQDFWEAVNLIDAEFDDQLCYTDEDGHEHKFDNTGGLDEFKTKYAQLNANYVRLSSVSKVAGDIDQGSKNPASSTTVANSIVQLGSEPIVITADVPSFATEVFHESDQNVINNGNISLKEDKQQDSSDRIQGNCHFAIVDKARSRPILLVREYPFRYVGCLSDGFYKVTFSKIVDVAWEDVFEHWIEADCKLEESTYLNRVVYLAKNSLSNTSHTISVIFENQAQLRNYVYFILEGIYRAKEQAQ